MSTLHANNSYHALGRILSFYAPEARPALLADLGAGLKAVVSQRLVRSNAGGRIPAVEVMLNSKLVSELIEKGDFNGVKEAMEKSLAEGSQTFEQDLATKAWPLPIHPPTCCGVCRTTCRRNRACSRRRKSRTTNRPSPTSSSMCAAMTA
jgi:Tfp pilus assembly pilus retraction ATPase PilT